MLPTSEPTRESALLAAWAIGAHTLERLGSTQNHAYRVDTEDGERFLLRVHVSHRSSLEIDAELAWLELVAATGTVAVPLPVRTTWGGWTSSTVDDGAVRHLSLLRWIDGIMLSALPPSADVEPFARTLAELHRRGAADDARALARSRRVYDSGYVRHRLDVIEETCGEDLDRGSTRADIVGGIAALDTALTSAGDPLMVHGDYHPGNLILGAESAAVIDFDRCGLGPAAFDVAAAILYLLPKQRIRFHRAYSESGGSAAIEQHSFGAFIFMAYLDNVAHLSKLPEQRGAMSGNIAQLAAIARAL